MYTSDEMLREKGFKTLISDIRSLNLERNGGYRDPAKIVIIGGSHSAFSIAWLLLNGPSKVKQFDAPFEFQKYVKNNNFYMNSPPRGP